jgi:hypothetical protein
MPSSRAHVDTYATLEPWQREMVMDGSSAIAEASTGAYTALLVYYLCAMQWFCSNTVRRGFITVTHGEFLEALVILMKMSFKVHCAKQ